LATSGAFEIATSNLSTAESPRPRARSDQLSPSRDRKLEAPGPEPAALRYRNWFADRCGLSTDRSQLGSGSTSRCPRAG